MLIKEKWIGNVTNYIYSIFITIEIDKTTIYTTDRKYKVDYCFYWQWFTKLKNINDVLNSDIVIKIMAKKCVQEMFDQMTEYAVKSLIRYLGIS